MCHVELYYYYQLAHLFTKRKDEEGRGDNGVMLVLVYVPLTHNVFDGALDNLKEQMLLLRRQVEKGSERNKQTNKQTNKQIKNK